MSERGSYTDQWERRDELDPRDLVPVRPDGVSTKVVVYDSEGFRRIIGDFDSCQIQQDLFKAE